jgi:hypothetical protein
MAHWRVCHENRDEVGGFAADRIVVNGIVVQSYLGIVLKKPSNARHL